MSFENRGGIPRVFRVTTDAVGGQHNFLAVTKYLQISNEGGDMLRVYFTEQDYTADQNYISLAAVTGFFDGPVEAQSIWFRADTTTTDLFMVSYHRRG